MTSLKPPRSDGLEPSTSSFQPCARRSARYISNRSRAKRLASSPPSAPRISTITFLSSLGSLGQQQHLELVLEARRSSPRPRRPRPASSRGRRRAASAQHLLGRARGRRGLRGAPRRASTIGSSSLWRRGHVAVARPGRRTASGSARRASTSRNSLSRSSSRSSTAARLPARSGRPTESVGQRRGRASARCGRSRSAAPVAGQVRPAGSIAGRAASASPAAPAPAGRRGRSPARTSAAAGTRSRSMPTERRPRPRRRRRRRRRRPRPTDVLDARRAAAVASTGASSTAPTSAGLGDQPARAASARRPSRLSGWGARAGAAKRGRSSTTAPSASAVGHRRRAAWRTASRSWRPDADLEAGAPVVDRRPGPPRGPATSPLTTPCSTTTSTPAGAQQRPRGRVGLGAAAPAGLGNGAGDGRRPARGRRSRHTVGGRAKRGRPAGPATPAVLVDQQVQVVDVPLAGPGQRRGRGPGRVARRPAPTATRRGARPDAEARARRRERRRPAGDTATRRARPSRAARRDPDRAHGGRAAARSGPGRGRSGVRGRAPDRLEVRTASALGRPWPRLAALAVAALEALDAATGVDQLLLAGEEGVALVARARRAARGLGRAGREGVAARAANRSDST